MQTYLFQIGVSVALLVALWAVKKALKTLIETLGSHKQVPAVRVIHILRYLNGLVLLAFFLLLMMVWGIDYRGLLLFASSVLAVIGVALVAQWSILSNVTAGVVVFFAFPARIGDVIEIIDGSNKLRGEIIEINLFQVVLKDSEGQTVAYPNNLVLQRPVVKVLEKPASKTSKNRPNRMQYRLKQRQTEK